MSEEVNDGYYVRRREFLNEDPELPAYVIGVAEDTRAISDDDPESGWNSGELMLDLADCNRRVSFYFDMRNERERANSLRKITLIAEVVSAMRDAIAAEVASRNARPQVVSPQSTEAGGEEPPAEVATELPIHTEEAPRAQVFTSHLITLGL